MNNNHAGECLQSQAERGRVLLLFVVQPEAPVPAPHVNATIRSAAKARNSLASAPEINVARIKQRCSMVHAATNIHYGFVLQAVRVRARVRPACMQQYLQRVDYTRQRLALVVTETKLAFVTASPAVH